MMSLCRNLFFQIRPINPLLTPRILPFQRVISYCPTAGTSDSNLLDSDDDRCISSNNVKRKGSYSWNGKKDKRKKTWVCNQCGATTGQWFGICKACRSMNTMVEFKEALEENNGKVSGFKVSEAAVRSWFKEAGASVPSSLADVSKGMNQSEWRITLPGLVGMEISRVLGGGVVPGSLILVGGDPGVGKSTLLLQISALLSEGFCGSNSGRILYVSGEESIDQIGNRADRLNITTADIFLYSSTDIEDIMDNIQVLSPQALIVDSIQTVYLRGVSGSAGSIMQVKECTSALLRFAKQTNIPVFLIGHVTKTGDIAGPRMLEHIVDTVLYMEGESSTSHRLLRSVKNRFGSTDELGVFEMSNTGLQAVLNPSEMFLSEAVSGSDISVGLAIAVIVDGSRTFVLEIQALCLTGSTTTKQCNGIDSARSSLIIAVLMKQAGLKLQDNAIFLNVVSGFKMIETAGDLAIAAAICSSFLEFPIPNDVAFIGEIGLAGELRTVPRLEKRISTISKLGYKKCVIPKSSEKQIASLNLDITLLGCRNLNEVIDNIFQMD